MCTLRRDVQAVALWYYIATGVIVLCPSWVIDGYAVAIGDDDAVAIDDVLVIDVGVKLVG